MHLELCYRHHHGSGGCVADPHGQEGSHNHETHEKPEMKRFEKANSKLRVSVPFSVAKHWLQMLGMENT